MTILPLTYLGNIEYFSHLMQGNCVIDLYEHYVKQSYRNRCEILTAGDVAALTVNVVKGGSMKKQPMRDMRIDYSKKWQHQHWMSIVSAYRNSPYFDHYEEMFAPFYEKQYTFLVDLNTALMETMTGILGNRSALRLSESYIEPVAGDVDLRAIFKPSLQAATQTPRPQYEQVFSDRFPFRQNLSVIDLIFCEGPSSKDFLKP